MLQNVNKTVDRWDTASNIHDDLDQTPGASCWKDGVVCQRQADLFDIVERVKQNLTPLPPQAKGRAFSPDGALLAGGFDGTLGDRQVQKAIKRNANGDHVHSFAGLIDHLGTMTRNTTRMSLAAKHRFTLLSTSTPLQQAAFLLLGFDPKRVQ